MYDLIQFKEVEFPDYAKMGIKISAEAIDIIKKLLAKQPKLRLGFNHDMEEVIAHPFFKEINVEELLSKKVSF
jgi:serum/glucocorticoid-regulated kinase 2